ncbi:integrase [Thiohalorhabdus denitrificans]|uniref:Bifunctional protein PutA n=1 Tax=Thiohalorhabdus denitrificans TaxID=381306 RepID=A0A0P9C8H8_9GAMM|nr:bifunctional proline dehydrogenase/L-glutamate gamma-semialdehyde dehydrogenase PutA [Thiohalorhabdus denitrificans]KPV41579.1 integrase [Thiohalorhabdus denitrificans]SCY30874.1 L-proline dehydrogenase /delta-1-pyrroline-5-carboxylate dehydrogenase [Thiohalorhabdus denitrificans]
MPTILGLDLPERDAARWAVTAAHLAPEGPAVAVLAEQAALDGADRERILERGRALVERGRDQPNPLDRFLHEYDLSNREGVLLMCLAEGLLRIPDPETADRLIHDKLGSAAWDRHLGHSGSLLVNASTWGLMLTGRLVRLGPGVDQAPSSLLSSLLSRSSEPVVRQALKRAMHLLARQFVMGEHIGEALQRARTGDNRRFRYSFDMLGEAAVSEPDAQSYITAYRQAIYAAGVAAGRDQPLLARPGISVKLSALHPRFAFTQRRRVREELAPRLVDLLERARTAGIPVTVDAEEAERLEPTLDVLETAFRVPAVAGWEGAGLAVQAYQKRALPVLDWVGEQAARRGARIPVRLVKGAYWDTEIKRAQQEGLAEYPVFTRKTHTDISYLACARRLAELGDRVFPQFATHNAHTIAAVAELMGARGDYEFQRLHGMGQGLYDEVVDRWGLPCRVYAPVGGHRELVPYLVRRLLENGANSSFINRIADQEATAEELLADPVETWRGGRAEGPEVPLPRDLFAERANSAGLPLDDPDVLAQLDSALRAAFARAPWRAAPRINGRRRPGTDRTLRSPGDHRLVAGTVAEADPEQARAAMAGAAAAFPAWSRTPVEERAAILERTADRIETERAGLVARIVWEGGRCIPDALAEVREAADFCRYYAATAREQLAERPLPGPTGERNVLRSEGRGVFLCVSPWNFPAAIFTGQIAAALAAGNSVVAKPARATPLTAMRIVELLAEAGVPDGAVQFLPGPSGELGPALLSDPRLAGVALTGGTDTARGIQRALAARDGPLVPLVAETGGVNALIVDSSALPEQVARDVVHSAFNSAGQRCSALRVLFLQEEVAPVMLDAIAGAVWELRVGDPARLDTDVGPVISEAARAGLEEHARRVNSGARVVGWAEPTGEAPPGSYFEPRVYELSGPEDLPDEVFGPILHVIRYRPGELDRVLDAVNGTGYGLTLGVHSRVEETARHIAERANVGNVYINRDIIGSVVGVQPFGGRGLSGTGPKAGGPHYLTPFLHEKTVTDNIAAVGGNATLLGGRYG